MHRRLIIADYKYTGTKSQMPQIHINFSVVIALRVLSLGLLLWTVRPGILAYQIGFLGRYKKLQ